MPIPGYPAVREPGVPPRRAPYFSGDVAQHSLGHWRAFRPPPVRARLRQPLTPRREIIMALSSLAAMFATALTLMTTPAAAQGVTDFYRGRTVSFVVGFGQIGRASCRE